MPTDLKAPAPPSTELPVLLVYLGLHGALGAAVGIACAALVILFDIGGLRSALDGSSAPLLPMALFYFAFALTVAGAKMAAAVMALPSPPARPHRED